MRRFLRAVGWTISILLWCLCNYLDYRDAQILRDQRNHRSYWKGHHV